MPPPSTEAFSITQPTLASLPALDRERARQELAGNASTPFVSELCHVGTVLWEEMPDPRRYSEWERGMRAIYGPAVTPFLRTAWERIDSVRYSLGGGLPPETVADIRRMEGEVEQSIFAAMAKNEPLPVYDATKAPRWWMAAWRPSAVIKYFGSDALLRKRNLMDLRTAHQAAAVRKQADELTRQLEASFYGREARGLRKLFRKWMPKVDLERFMRFALPVTARLNVTGGSEGNWVFEAFDMRAGFMPEREASRMGYGTGSTMPHVNPINGEQEMLTLGERIELDDGRKGFQLLRHMTEERQAALYEWATARWPQFAWFLDTWMDPRLANTRITINGVQVPAFNRLALANLYRQGDPSFQAREAYTPDVSIGTGIIGLVRQFRRRREYNLRAGSTSPGRKYETGAAREAGNVMDLLSGFNVRSMQALQEGVRREWVQDVLGAAQQVPDFGKPLPEGWVSLDQGMKRVWQAVQTLRKFDDPLKFPQTTERFRDDSSPEYQAFFGELLRMRAAQPEMMLPEPLVKALEGDFAQAATAGMAMRVARWWGRNWKSWLLMMPDTFLENRTDNYLRLLMQAHRQMILAALRGGDRLALREAKNLAWTAIVNVVPFIRPLFHLNNHALFQMVTENVIPDEVFTGATRLADLNAMQQDDLKAEVRSLAAQGRRLAAASTVALNLGPILLEETGYGQMDVKAKQQFAFSLLLARAQHEAWSRKLRGEAREKFIEAWLRKPPESVVRKVVEGANRALLNYGDTPGWVGRFARHPISNLVFAFPLFRYHFIGRELDRATSAFRALHKTLIRGQKLTRAEWASSLADLISYVTLPVMGYTVAQVTGALADTLLGGLPPDEEEEDPRLLVGSSIRIEKDPVTGEAVRTPLPRELVTSNRINLTRMLETFGVDPGDRDLWFMYKDYPVVRSAAMFHQVAADTLQHGPAQGILTLGVTLKDFLTSLTGAGQALKVPSRLAESFWATAQGERVEPGFFDPYGASVPLDAYLTLQALNLVPAGRQADELIKWIDPTPRRITKSKALDYDPGVVEALQTGGWTGLADRLLRGATTGTFASPLPPQGLIDKRAGVVTQPREHGLAERLGAVMGVALKDVPRAEYQAALEED